MRFYNNHLFLYSSLRLAKSLISQYDLDNDLTQEELANLIGISRQAINAIEKEKFDPSLPTILIKMRYFKTKHQQHSARLTAVIMLLLVLLLFVVGPGYMDPPLEYGVAVNFGSSDTGSGLAQPKETLASWKSFNSCFYSIFKMN